MTPNPGVTPLAEVAPGDPSTPPNLPQNSPVVGVNAEMGTEAMGTPWLGAVWASVMYLKPTGVKLSHQTAEFTF